MELEVTTGRVMRVWWSYFWRNLVGLTLVTMMAMLIGIFLGIAGVDPNTPINKVLILAVAFVLTLAATVIPIQMILGRNFGEFRLVLLSTQIPPTTPGAPAYSAEEKAVQQIV